MYTEWMLLKMGWEGEAGRAGVSWSGSAADQGGVGGWEGRLAGESTHPKEHARILQAQILSLAKSRGLLVLQKLVKTLTKLNM